MSTILVTGASGFIGRHLAPSLAKQHDVICIGRNKPPADVHWFRGSFGAFEDLRALDAHHIDVLVHLAAVTGGCSERDGMLVNVEGTRCLMRYLIDRGCRRYVMASSIAAVGFQSVDFLPRKLPIPPEHECLDRDGYGFSKHMMEQVTEYYVRQNPDIDVINLRLCSVPHVEQPPPLREPAPLAPWALGSITVMTINDCVRLFQAAVAAPPAAGVRRFNGCGRRAWVQRPVTEFLRGWYGDDVDVSYFEQPGQEWDSVFAPTGLQEELGFVAQDTPDTVFPGSQPPLG